MKGLQVASSTRGWAIQFAESAPDGHLRHVRFIGLREDKDPKQVRRDD
jgi:ATP-dependent DNA ligase